MNDRRIVFTGIGPVSSLGAGKDLFWKNLVCGTSHISLMSDESFDSETEPYFINKIDDLSLDSVGLDPLLVEYVLGWREQKENKDLTCLALAVKLAIEDSKMSPELVADSGLILVHENPSLEQLLGEFFYAVKALKDLDKPKDNFKFIFSRIVKTAYETQSFMLLFHIAKLFSIRRYSLCLNNACSSGLYALEAAKDIILSGKVDRVIIAGSDCPSVFKHLWFKSLGMYAEDGIMKPFDKEANGFVLGEGGSAIVLESMDVALNRKAKIYGEYCGGAFRMEGWKVALPAVHENHLEEVINESLRNSLISKDCINLICAHGVATSINDKYEIRSIKKVFDSQAPYVTALKPYFGHNLGSSSLLELSALLLFLENQKILPIKNLSNVVDSASHVNFVREMKSMNLNVILKICSAFAGYDSAVVVRSIFK